MTTRVDQHRGPHMEIQKLLHRAAREGAARATVDIWAGRLEYRDDRPFHTTIDTSDIDPDDIYTVDWGIEKYPAPDGLHVHVLNHNSWGALARSGRHTHLEHIGEGDEAPPRLTESARCEVRLKKRNRGHGEILILNQEGVVCRRNRHFGLTARHAAGQPGEQVQETRYTVLARPAPGTAEPPDAVDEDEIFRTAAAMFADLIARNNREAGNGASTVSTMWPDRQSGETLEDMGLRLAADPPATCRTYHHGTRINPEILMPEDAVLSLLPHASGPWLAQALANHPEPGRRHNLVESAGEAGKDLPTLRMTGARAVWPDGRERELPVPERSPERSPEGNPEEAPDDSPAGANPRRLDATVMERVSAITATLEYREHGREPERFELELDAYTDHDWDNHLILTTPGLDMDWKALSEAAGIWLHRVSRHAQQTDWETGYHAKRLTGGDPDTVNQDALNTIVENLEAAGLETPGRSITARSPGGTIEITLVRKGHEGT